MKQLLILLLLTGLLYTRSSAQVFVNSDGTAPDNSAMLDVKSANKGLLIPRVALTGTGDVSTVPNRVESLLIYNTATADTSPNNVTPGYYYWSGSAWVRLSVNAGGSGTINYLPNWDSSGMLGNSLLFDDAGNVGIGTTSPAKKLEILGEMQATGTGNNYFAGKVGIGTSNPAASAAVEISSTSKGLLPPRMTIAQRDAIASPVAGLIIWCTNCGTSGELQVNNGSAWTNMTGKVSGCGVYTVKHTTTGSVAPVNKTVTYGTVTNVPGEPSKCWITSNLGADRQATAVTDATEPSAGWYWQFNRKQGYKHDGTTRTPSTPAWITSINEDHDWQAVNDPCTIELGTGWRIPTNTEWTNVDAGGSWTTRDGPWNSLLKMHTSGWLNFDNGYLSSRGAGGTYWSDTQSTDHSKGQYLSFGSGDCAMINNFKSYGFTIRCIKCVAPSPPAPGTHVPSAGQIIWNWNPAAGATGYKWNTDNNYATATDMGTATTKTETVLACSASYTRFVWAYNSCGNSSPLSLTQSILSTFTDERDGKTYNTVLIEAQCWMAQNLNVGTRINGSGNQTNNSAIEKYCYGDNESNCDTYGGLYQWNEAMQYSTPQGEQGICPAGWHLPSDDEWTTLTDYVNSQPSYQCNSTSGYIAKAMAATTLWNGSSYTCAVGNDLSLNNATGFTGLPGGGRYYFGSFLYVGYYGYWWSSTVYSSSIAWYRDLNYNDGGMNVGIDSKQNGFSVRCLQD